MTLNAAAVNEQTDADLLPSMEEHDFVASPGLVMHVINSQSGSIGKAVGECVMNSIDAGATAIHITLDADRVVILDDGHGLRSRDELLAVFKVFGFDHSEHERKYGKFGLGRGQLWKFAKSRWYTHAFMLDVDVRTRGLRWFLHKDQPHVDGLRIEGDFYERLRQSDIMETTREIEKLVKYSATPVFLNGRNITRDPAADKWDEVTDEAYIRISESPYLRVYNMGVFVTDIYAGYQGVGGTLVTKPGQKLVLNMARNEVDRALCPLWRKLQKTTRELADKRLGKESKKRLSDADRDYIATQTAAPETYIEAAGKACITLCTNKHIALEKLTSELTRWRSEPIYLTAAETGSRIGETLQRDKTAIVLAQATLERFGVATVNEFVDLIDQRHKAAARHAGGVVQTRLSHRDLAARKNFTVADDIKDVPAYRHLNHSKIPAHELTKQQRHFLMAVQEMVRPLGEAFTAHGMDRAMERELFLGRSDSAEAYTDGSGYIAFVDTTVAAAIKQGLPGFMRIAHLFVHEMLHDDDDSGSHVHDPQFYEDFHDLVLDQGEKIYRAAADAFKRYAKLAGVNTKTAAQLDRMQQSDAVVSKAG